MCAEVAIVILDENTPASRSWFTWRDILHLVDIVCCCAILFPIVWSIKHLREAAGVCAVPLLLCAALVEASRQPCLSCWALASRFTAVLRCQECLHVRGKTALTRC